MIRYIKKYGMAFIMCMFLCQEVRAIDNYVDPTYKPLLVGAGCIGVGFLIYKAYRALYPTSTYSSCHTSLYSSCGGRLYCKSSGLFMEPDASAKTSIINGIPYINEKKVEVIEPSGVIESREFNFPIENLAVYHCFAHFKLGQLKENETPYIQGDSNFLDAFMLQEENGELVAHLKDKTNAVRVGQEPMAIIYAIPYATSLQIKDKGVVDVENCNVSQIILAEKSQLKGSINLESSSFDLKTDCSIADLVINNTCNKVSMHARNKGHVTVNVNAHDIDVEASRSDVTINGQLLSGGDSRICSTDKARVIVQDTGSGQIGSGLTLIAQHGEITFESTKEWQRVLVTAKGKATIKTPILYTHDVDVEASRSDVTINGQLLSGGDSRICSTDKAKVTVQDTGSAQTGSDLTLTAQQAHIAVQSQKTWKKALIGSHNKAQVFHDTIQADDLTVTSNHGIVELNGEVKTQKLDLKNRARYEASGLKSEIVTGSATDRSNATVQRPLESFNVQRDRRSTVQVVD